VAVTFFTAGLRAVVAFFAVVFLAAGLRAVLAFFAVDLAATGFFAAGFLAVVDLPAEVDFFTVAFFAVVVFAVGLRTTAFFPAVLPDVFVVVEPDPLDDEREEDVPVPLRRIVVGLAVASGEPSDVLPVVGSFFALPPGRLVMRATLRVV